jgi:recombination protein RecA
LFVAPEHAGKSSFMALLAAKAKEKYNSQIVVIDTEGGWDTNFCKRWGLNPEEILYIYTPWIDEIKVVLANIVDGEEDNLIVVLDSIGGIEKKKILDDALKGDPKADQGTLQKELKPMYKLLSNIVKVKNSIALSAGHYYGNPSSYGDADQISGGKYLKLAVDITVAFKKSKMIDDEKNVIGNRLTATTMKNRMYPPFHEATIEIDYQNGINVYSGLLEIALESEVIEKSGNTYIYRDSSGTEYKAVGEKQAYTKLFEVHGEKIVDKINDYVKTTGFSTINAEIKDTIEAIEDSIASGEDIEN